MSPVVLDQLLESCVCNNGSDLHIKADSPPLVRVHGDLIPLDMEALTADEASFWLGAAAAWAERTKATS